LSGPVSPCYVPPMGWPALTASVLALALLAAPAAAGAGEVYSFVDADGVIHFTNTPSAPRYPRERRTQDVAGLYRSPTSSRGPAESRALPAAGRHGPYVEHIRTASAKYRLPEALILAVMAVESNFDPRALSDKGAMGLMQLMPATARDLYVADAWDPAQNIEGGTRYLRLLANQYAGDIIRTLAAYNAGPEAVRRAGDTVPDIPETREYVRKVVALYQVYKAGR
jgi:soluble lytic murein transglycosylase-like protein